MILQLLHAKILKGNKGIFPSDIGEVTDFSQPTFLIDDNGGFVPAAELSRDGYVVYDC